MISGTLSCSDSILQIAGCYHCAADPLVPFTCCCCEVDGNPKSPFAEKISRKACDEKVTGQMLLSGGSRNHVGSIRFFVFSLIFPTLLIRKLSFDPTLRPSSTN